jgi:nicotinamide phosphoribosyltransferase
MLAQGELEGFRSLLTETYPTGMISLVSDTWDFWRVVAEYLPVLKNEIMARDGKVVIRPDSSPKTPVEIIIGDPEATPGTGEFKGLIEALWDIFGGSINSKGYKELDPHIGAIYGDSITLEYAEAIVEGLKQKGFASTNIVFGVGSFTYTFVTRDTHGIAMKATAISSGRDEAKIWKPIFKDPKTDTSDKKSAKGFLRVDFDSETKEFKLIQNVTQSEAEVGVLRDIYLNGTILEEESFENVRERLESFL